MISGVRSGKLDRRIIIKAAAATGVAQLAAPFSITARAADEVKFGLNDPLTGTYAELGKNEQSGNAESHTRDRGLPRFKNRIAARKNFPFFRPRPLLA